MSVVGIEQQQVISKYSPLILLQELTCYQMPKATHTGGETPFQLILKLVP
jgi:hypothetical protein